MDKDLRIGDVVHVTARVTGLRGDGTYNIEPVGFDYDAEGDVPYEGDISVDFYTVDDPVLVRRGLMKGDEKFSGDGERYCYHEDLGEGLHLLNKPDAKQHLTGAWVIWPTEHVMALRDEPPELDQTIGETLENAHKRRR